MIEALTTYGLLLYYASAVLCLLRAIERTADGIREDLRVRDLHERGHYSSGYCPTTTLGSVARLLLLAAIPVVNTGFALAYVVHHLLDALDWVEHVLRTPLVPRRKPKP